MRANGTRTPIELANELARIDHHIDTVKKSLGLFETEAAGGVQISPALGEAWNALHDAVTALEAERREVELNAPYADATAFLVHQNID